MNEQLSKIAGEAKEIGERSYTGKVWWVVAAIVVGVIAAAVLAHVL